jgi:SpoVK/Ycf46/Vps4 family AAA+-type ATPase
MPSLELNETFYDGFFEYVVRKFQVANIDAGRSLYTYRMSVTKVDLKKIFPSDTIVEEKCKHQVAIGNLETYIVLSSSPSKTISHIEIYATDENTLESVKSQIGVNSVPAPPQIKWVYKGDGTFIRLPIDTSILPLTEFYPLIKNSSLQQYYDSYLASRSSVLVLIGPPGTGKTSFIKGLIAHSGSGAIISYDNNILENDGIFADFMSGDEKFMVLEDADSFLKCRNKTGNTIMHKFLNIADGLISTEGKKIIFSTNLPSTRDIDPALIRPGRCFDTLRFSTLTRENCIGIDSEYSGEGNITLAELLCTDKTNHEQYETGRVGF